MLRVDVRSDAGNPAMAEGRAIVMPRFARTRDGASAAAGVVRLPDDSHRSSTHATPAPSSAASRPDQREPRKPLLWPPARSVPDGGRADDGPVVRGGVPRSPLGGHLLQPAR